MSQSKRVLYISCAAIALIAARGGWVLADDFVVDAPSNQTNAGNVLVNGDSITITETGSITPPSGDRAINTTVDNITVINRGIIVGDDATGIYLDNDDSVFNFGEVSTSGDFSRGIWVNDDGSIFNFGAIATSGNRSSGILADSDNVITNFGVITTSGDDAYAIEADFRNTITNSGSLLTSGVDAHGIAASDRNTIINTGAITTTGSSAAAIRGRDATITNSGRLVSAQSDSLSLLGSSNILNLHAPSFLGGRIDMATGTTVSIFSGPSHSILWDLSTGTMNGGAPTLSGPVPIFYNSATQQVATFDPTALSGSANALGDMSGNLSALMGQRLSLSRASGSAEGEADASFLSAYSGNEETTDNTAIDRIATAFRDTSDADTGWWVSGFGSYADHDGTAATLDHTYDHFGVATGYDWQPSSALTLGAMVGYGTGSFDTDSRFAGSFDNSADGAFAGFYGRADLANSMFVDFALSSGLLSHSDSRFVNDNLAPLGVSSASADYDSWWLSPELTLGMEISDVMGSQWSYIPSASIRYALQSVDGYTETGPSAANATVNAHDVAMLETRLELAGMRDFELATLRGHFGGRFGWQHRSAMGDDAVAITMIGQNNSVSTFSQDGSTVYVGVDAAMDVGNSASVALGGEYSFSGTVQALRGTATLTIMF